MSERDDYAPGVPCWVDTWQADAAATAAFYAELMGWETERTTPDDAEAQYVMCRLRGRDVAAIGSGVAGAGASGVGGAGASASAAGPGASPAGTAHTRAAWTTYVQVVSVEDTVAKAREAGGTIVAPPFDSLDGGASRSSPTRSARASASGRRARIAAPRSSTSPAPGR